MDFVPFIKDELAGLHADGWILSVVLGGAVLAGRQVFAALRRKRQQHLDWEQLAEESQCGKALTSRFVAQRSEMEEVLEIRRRVFEKVLNKPLVSTDHTYWECFERNKQAFKLVGQAHLFFGYWGAIPVSAAHFAQFTAGELTHAQMLSDCTLSWADVDPDALYLYFIGIVSLSKTSLSPSEPHLTLMEAKVIQDAMATLATVSDHATIKGIAVYASTKFGARISENRLIENGFRQTGVFASSDRITEILVLDGENSAPFFARLREKHLQSEGAAGVLRRAKRNGLQPVWSEQEQQALIEALTHRGPPSKIAAPN